VADNLWPRVELTRDFLQGLGFQVEIGECMHTPTHTSGSREHRASELMAMLLDPEIRAVVPPWGGETGIDLLDVLDFEAVARAEPTWCVGYSDTSTWLTPLTLRTGIATIHGQNFMDTLYDPPAGIHRWTEVAAAEPGATVTQHSPGQWRSAGHDDWVAEPGVREYTLDTAGAWRRIDPGAREEPTSVSGRVIAGCVETLSFLAGRGYADIGAFAGVYAPEGILHVLDIAEWGAYDICRALHSMRLNGWFDHSNGILVSRTKAPAAPGFSQHDAVVDPLGMLGVPIIAEVECGHVAPYLALLQGAPTTVTLSAEEQSVTQHLA
jgi:muramoyltetrapeptide carboxypeptidase LdcA involved in peptidoglycan recycling